jgi:hypothetical protein
VAEPAVLTRVILKEDEAAGTFRRASCLWCPMRAELAGIKGMRKLDHEM